MEENNEYLTEQILTYLGNKRKLLTEISTSVEEILEAEKLEKARICDIFSGSGIVARKLKKHANELIVNDLEAYSAVTNECYLSNKEDFDEAGYAEGLKLIMSKPLVEGIIAKNYSPANDLNIMEGERAFYTHENAMIIDTIRSAIDEIPQGLKKYFIAPLLYEASVHVNTSGVFKGFYKSKTRNVGKFGGEGANSLERITKKIELKKPVLSNFSSKVTVFQKDANILAEELKGLDITYMDPPYNQHPYGSNYFMLNTILKNEIGPNISKVAGIPDDWNKSPYNRKGEALKTFSELIDKIDSRHIIISYNNEGFISKDEMTDMLSTHGDVKMKEIDYSAFKGSRNFRNRKSRVTEFLFTLHK